MVVTVKVTNLSGRKLREGEEETRRYIDLDCALTDCTVRSSQNKVLVSKIFNRTAEDPHDYYIQICD